MERRRKKASFLKFSVVNKIMAKTKAQVTAWCNAISDYKKDGSNAGEISAKIFKELIADIPNHGLDFGPSGDDYVLTLTSGSAAGTYTITGVD